MTTYLLHGGMLKVHNSSNESYFKRIVESVPVNGTVLIVLFAAEEQRWPELFTTMQTYIAERSEGKPITYRLATKEHFIEEAHMADAIVIRGGETNRLLNVLETYPHLQEVFEGKLVAGSSAGAYALGTYNYSRTGKSIRKGLGLVPSRVLCHFESSDDKEYNGPEALQIMESEHQDLPLIVLRDCEWKEFSL